MKIRRDEVGGLIIMLIFVAGLLAVPVIATVGKWRDCRSLGHSRAYCVLVVGL